MKVAMEHRCRSRFRAHAFAMIESLVGATLIGVAFVALYAGIGFGFQIVGLAREDLRATQIMLEQLETIRLYTFDQIETPGFIPVSFTEYYYPRDDEQSPAGQEANIVYKCRLTITDSPVSTSYASNLKSVSVHVEWVSNGITRRREMHTFISRGGIQNYVY